MAALLPDTGICCDGREPGTKAANRSWRSGGAEALGPARGTSSVEAEGNTSGAGNEDKDGTAELGSCGLPAGAAAWQRGTVGGDTARSRSAT